MKMPPHMGPVHFVGVGGIGMSALAETLIGLGYQVQGSDLKENMNVRRLKEKGARIFIGHDSANIDGAEIIVVSSAIKSGNPEYDTALASGLPIVLRAELLAELMRLKASVAVAGTHGKTTTTSLVSVLLEAGGIDPTVINGGIINAYGSNARMGQGEWIVAEADESDGTFTKLPTQVGIVTNIDPEHMDHYRDFDALRAAFQTFIDNIPFYGFAVACIDHAEVRQIVERARRKRIITYGESPDADVRMTAHRDQDGQVVFDVELSDALKGGARALHGLALPLPGRHNALNAIAAMIVAIELGIDDGIIRSALANFAGVRRRFTLTGSWKDVAFYDDYAHHPVEIRAVLSAARGAAHGHVVAIMQPHRFTRLSGLFDDFAACVADADTVIVTPVYAAGEAPIEGVDHETLAARIKALGHNHVVVSPGGESLALLIATVAEPGDLVIGLGAGNVTEWSYALPHWLQALDAAPGGAA